MHVTPAACISCRPAQVVKRLVLLYIWEPSDTSSSDHGSDPYATTACLSRFQVGAAHGHGVAWRGKDGCGIALHCNASAQARCQLEPGPQPLTGMHAWPCRWRSGSCGAGCLMQHVTEHVRCVGCVGCWMLAGCGPMQPMQLRLM